MRTISFLSMATFIALSATQAHAEKEPPTALVSTHFMFGGILADPGNLNPGLDDQGFASVSDYGFVPGLGFQLQKHRLMLGAEFLFYAWQKQQRGDKLVSMYGHNAILNVGFNVLPESRFRLYPFAGGGLGRLNLKLRQTEGDFDQVVGTETLDVRLSQRTFVIQAGLGGDFRFASRRHPAKKKTIGFRVGYLFDTTPANDWSRDFLEVRGGPSMSTTGFYGQITLGISKPKRGHCHGCSAGKDKDI